MTWHVEVVGAAHLAGLLGAIRSGGGTVTSSRPCPDGYSITYVTFEE